MGIMQPVWKNISIETICIVVSTVFVPSLYVFVIITVNVNELLKLYNILLNHK